MADQPDSVYVNNGEIAALVERFSSFAIHPAEMSHRKHVAMTAYCFLTQPPRAAAERVVADLKDYVERYGIKIYNETITLFWTKLVGAFVAGADRSQPAYQVVNQAMERFGDSRIIFEYYTRERLFSDEARRDWVEPDLRKIDSSDL